MHVYTNIQWTHCSKIVHGKDSINLSLLLLLCDHEQCGRAGIF